MDTGSQTSVKDFCARWKATGKPIDRLILNAGISNVPKREETVDGFERQFATNYLGHFTMTALLLPSISSNGRMILVSSLSHKRVRLNLDDLQSVLHYSPMKAYSQSKLAVLTFALELSRRLTKRGSQIKVIPVHPGIAATGITRGGDRMNPIFQRLASKMFGVVGQSAAQGAWPILYAATSDRVKTGAFYGPSGRGERKGMPGPAQIAPQATDHKLAEKLWLISEKLTGIDFFTVSQ